MGDVIILALSLFSDNSEEDGCKQAGRSWECYELTSQAYVWILFNALVDREPMKMLKDGRWMGATSENVTCRNNPIASVFWTCWSRLMFCTKKQRVGGDYTSLKETMQAYIYKKAVLSQKWPRAASIYGCPEIFGSPWLRPCTATFPEIVNGLLLRSILVKCVQSLKFVDLPVPEIIRGTQKISAVPRYAHAPFSPKFQWACVRMDPVKCECTSQIWSP